MGRNKDSIATKHMTKYVGEKEKVSTMADYRTPCLSLAACVLISFVAYRAYLLSVAPCPEPDLAVTTWNIAAINNNPFEYWITHEDQAYNDLMEDVQNFIENPGAFDVPVNHVFTEDMFQTLKRYLSQVEGHSQTHVESVEEVWKTSFQHRHIVSGILKDGELGKKRLMSMPDRITNTIETSEGIVFRPTVMNCYDGQITDMANWWKLWTTFMFKTDVSIPEDSEVQQKKVYDMLSPIKQSKYPAITLEEEAMSLPLQTLSLAVFDAILIHMMNQLAPNTWQGLRSEICAALNQKKMPRVLEILQLSYSGADIIFLQEVAASFMSVVQETELANWFHVLRPANADASRSQNSFILLKKDVFRIEELQEVTNEVLKQFDPSLDVPIEPGDLFAVVVPLKYSNTPHLLASFHGDTNGLATIPVVRAVHAASRALGVPKMVFGLDANTYEVPAEGWQDVKSFGEFFVNDGLTSCWGDVPNPKQHTTFNARTYLQTQLNKAAKKSELLTKGDKNPKDFILFQKDDYVSMDIVKDNTGMRKYVENMLFPTLTFPSDHGVLSALLRPLQCISKENE